MVWKLPLARRWMLQRALSRDWQKLRQFALHLTRNPDHADDLLQVASERAARKLEQLRDPAKFRPWMFQILRNCHVDELRRPSQPAYDNLVELPAPDIALADRQLGECIAVALEDLPEKQRTAVWLVDVEGLTFGDAARVLDVRPGTVASRVARGRSTLRGELAEAARERGVIA